MSAGFVDGQISSSRVKKKIQRPLLGKRKFSKCVDRQRSNAQPTRFSCLNFDRSLFVTVRKD